MAYLVKYRNKRTGRYFKGRVSKKKAFAIRRASKRGYVRLYDMYNADR